MVNDDEDEDEEGRLDREKGNRRTLIRMKSTIVGSSSGASLPPSSSKRKIGAKLKKMGGLLILGIRMLFLAYDSSSLSLSCLLA